MSTRAEEIAAEGPYRADWENGMSVVRDLNAPEGNKIMMMMPDNMEWFAERMNDAHIKGYKQGQQDRWISVKDRVPEDDRRVLVTDGVSVLETRHNGSGFKMPRPFPAGLLVDVTHWCELPSPPNPEQRCGSEQ